MVQRLSLSLVRPVPVVARPLMGTAVLAATVQTMVLVVAVEGQQPMDSCPVRAEVAHLALFKLLFTTDWIRGNAHTND